MRLVPAFGATPGAPELLAILLLTLLLFGLVVAGVVFVLRYSQNRSGDDRVAELEARVAELEQERERWHEGDEAARSGVREDDVAARDTASAEEAVEDWEGADDRSADEGGDGAPRE